MPITVRNDVQPLYSLPDRFLLGDTPDWDKRPLNFRDVGGSYLNLIRPHVAIRNWNQFYASKPWDDLNAAREFAKAIGLRFDLDPSLTDAFDNLWVLMAEARQYEKQQKDKITGKNGDLDDAYGFAAQLAKGKTINKPTFSRPAPSISDDQEKVVIFSDFHMTNFNKLPNYFYDFNYQLYLDVLNHYADNEFTLIENGDVEDCVLFEPDNDSANKRRKAAPNAFGIREIAYPVLLTDSKWDDFLTIRYDKRLQLQDAIFNLFSDYYKLIQDRFIKKGRYVRLVGNHDTYLKEDRENKLRSKIEEKLLGTEVYDYVLIKRNQQISYLVIHGHQFDAACVQHGEIPYAKSLGEMYTECGGWANQGADRAWWENDTKRWYIGKTYLNQLVSSTPAPYPRDAKLDLIVGNVDEIKAHAKSFIETILENEVAWEYFENSDAFEAFTLEVWRGDDMYKLRHLDEIKLYKSYLKQFDAGAHVPTLVIGHTHEPRQGATYPEDNIIKTAQCYLNSGSAGRYQNLIWGIEIDGDSGGIVSWSRINGALTRIPWRNNHYNLEHATNGW